MLFREGKDWKKFLSPDDEKRLNEILQKVGRYRGAYKNADNIRLAQMWCAILNLYKENRILQNRIVRLEDVLDGAFERIRKQEEERKTLVKSLDNF